MEGIYLSTKLEKACDILFGTGQPMSGKNMSLKDSKVVKKKGGTPIDISDPASHNDFFLLSIFVISGYLECEI